MKNARLKRRIFFCLPLKLINSRQNCCGEWIDGCHVRTTILNLQKKTKTKQTQKIRLMVGLKRVKAAVMAELCPYRACVKTPAALSSGWAATRSLQWSEIRGTEEGLVKGRRAQRSASSSRPVVGVAERYLGEVGVLGARQEACKQRGAVEAHHRGHHQVADEATLRTDWREP